MTAGKHIRRSVLLLRKVFHARFFLLGTAGRAAVVWFLFPFTLRSSYFAVCENLSAHNLQPLYETVFTCFPKIKVIMMNVSLFLLLFLYIITIIPSKKHLTYTSSQITYLFNWHFRETLFIFRTILLPL